MNINIALLKNLNKQLLIYCNRRDCRGMTISFTRHGQKIRIIVYGGFLSQYRITKKFMLIKNLRTKQNFTVSSTILSDDKINFRLFKIHDGNEIPIPIENIDYINMNHIIKRAIYKCI